MYDPRPPRRIPSIDDRTVLETVVVSLATTGLFVAAMVAALGAAALAGDDPIVSAPVAILAGIVTLAVGALSLGAFGSRLGRAIGRRRARAS
ncbi:hypothetical protein CHINAEXTREME_07050 [Halobiforma lacisalsi AJ5]|uniref:Uncharacterized protein n=1 Tax=Natronobacterium lacisalsi AJ5 TaxID=358396 RepID=M0LV95_NATLA|nr:hypothetical protein [Halobiforma lacisalsi]APW97546.1 hypothetical protein CHINAEXTREME_07050 [Halobiforma lacisalsi AJ5]EMA37073.1 hypothetical protein C445_02496 [Halobiforma lacisalsi AJ5]